jgi:glycosyltransferase involved in cell wall biosynthesis
MKKILIVSYLFAPHNIIGAIRPTKIAKHLVIQGYDVTVVCGNSSNVEDDMLKKDCEHINKIIRINHSKLYIKIYNMILNNATFLGFKCNSINDNSNLKNQNRKKSWFKEYLLKFAYLLYLYRDFDFYNRASKSIKFNEYDILFSSYGPIGNHFLGRWIKRKNKNIKWIADFRDPMLPESFPFGLRTYISNLQKSFCEKSDYITTVSKGCLNQILNGNGKYLNKSTIITNGYDILDFQAINKIDMNNVEKFTFIYTGTTYRGGRGDLSPLFKAICELHNEGKINKDIVQFYYAGRDGTYVKYQAMKYNCDNIIIDFGFVPRMKSLELQNQSHILVVTTWNEKKSQGILSGKFLEYMMYKKPIIAIVSGDVKTSEISRIIDECRIGEYYERVQHDIHFSNIKNYILNQYLAYTNKSVEFTPSLQELDKYNYANLTKKLIDIFENL